MREGAIPAVFHESDDPNRMVPIVWKPEDFMIAVGGDPMRNNAYIFAHNAFLGYPVGRKIELRPESAIRSQNSRSRARAPSRPSSSMP